MKLRNDRTNEYDEANDLICCNSRTIRSGTGIDAATTGVTPAAGHFNIDSNVKVVGPAGGVMPVF